MTAWLLYSQNSNRSPAGNQGAAGINSARSGAVAAVGSCLLCLLLSVAFDLAASGSVSESLFVTLFLAKPLP